MINNKVIVIILFLLSFTFFLTGCTVVFQKGRRSDIEKIQDLSQQLDRLSQAQRILQDRLSQEIKDKQVRLERMEKGLVITFVADILFDSGKAKIRPNAFSILDKVAKVLKENVPEFDIGIEGHTDNEPIKFSPWKDNWELSTQRALSVLRYLVQERSISEERVAAIGYGQQRPIASNDSVEGQQFNRRVEIVVLPKTTKVKTHQEQEKLLEPEENLK